MNIPRSLVPTLFFAFALSITHGLGADLKPSTKARRGLGSSAHAFVSTGSGRVAFLGGSITEMDGYRPPTANVLRSLFPDTRFDFINAGIASTGSTTGAFRLESDVLSRGKIDLLFVEFAVNDDQDSDRTDTEMVRAMEGIALHAREQNPAVDIVFLYTANESHIQKIQMGSTPHEILAHDKVAEYYGLPSVSLAADVATRMGQGEFDWKKFGGVHPAPFGADLYAAEIAALLQNSCIDRGKPAGGSHPSTPLDPLNYRGGHFVDLNEASIQTGWSVGEPDWDSLPGQKRDHFVGIPMLYSETPGATLALDFSGSAIGIYLVSGPDAGVIEYSIDGGEPQHIDLYRPHSKNLHYPWTYMFATGLSPGTHSITLRIAATKNPASQGTAARIKTFVAN